MRERILFDEGWRFHIGDKKPDRPSWSLIKSGVCDQTWADKNLDDSDWRKVDLPHDFVMENDVTPPDRNRDAYRKKSAMDYLGDLHVARGSRAGGIAWYRKKFTADGSGKRVSLWFDGVYRNCEVYVNNFFVERHQSGYTGFSCDITDFLEDGKENTVAVRVDASEAEGWFYEGGGIYRHVWLVSTPPVAIARHGVFIKSEVDLAHNSAELIVETRVENKEGASREAAVGHVAVSPCGEKFVLEEKTVCVPGRDSSVIEHRMTIPNPRLWDVENPNLYTLRTTLSTGDEVTAEFGIRKIHFDADKGFFLNGKQVKIKGVCCHQDHAGLGCALPDGMQYYRIKKLKEMGCNAYRCAHNPVADELLEACDRLGMLVMNENRLLSSSRENLEQLGEMVLSSRNHPCVFLWSLGNEEVSIQFTKQGRKIARTMKEYVKKLDPTRPVTAAVCMWEAGKLGQTVEEVSRQGMLEPSVDVFGFNYFSEIWDGFHKAYPHRPLICTEDCSFSGTRDCRRTQDDICHMSAMDARKGSYLAGEKEWIAAADREYIAGTFIWTGFDYHGEPSPYGWPATASQFGIMDLCGFPKETYYYYKAWWSPEDVLYLCSDEKHVWCMTNCEDVELLSEKGSWGVRKVEKNRVQIWENAGSQKEIRAIGRRNGKTLYYELRRGGRAEAIRAEAEYMYREKNGSKTVVICAELVDQNGFLAEDADDRVTVSYPEQVTLLGTGNGDPSSHENVKCSCRRAFHGRLQIILAVSGDAVVWLEAPNMEKVPIDIKM